MAIRVAITGRTATPPLFDTIVALGLERTLERLDSAREALADRGLSPDRRRQVWRRCLWHDAHGRRPDDASIELRSRPGWTATSRPGRATTRPRSATCSATDATYRYHPEDEPLVGREAIVADWLEDRGCGGHLRRPLRAAGHRRRGPCRDRLDAATSTAPAATLRDEYWNVYLVRFDDAGQATVVHRVVDPGPRVRPARPGGSRRQGARRSGC